MPLVVIASSVGQNSHALSSTPPRATSNEAGSTTAKGSSADKQALAPITPSANSPQPNSLPDSLAKERGRTDDTTSASQSLSVLGEYPVRVALAAAALSFISFVLALYALILADKTRQSQLAARQIERNREMAPSSRDQDVLTSLARLTAYVNREFQDFGGRMEHLEHLVQEMPDRVPPKQATLLGEPTSSSVERAQAHEVVDTQVDVIPGALSDGDEVRVSTSSKPMVEIRWCYGLPTAEVWINREFKFADLTAEKIISAFDIEGGGPGAYETITPAVIDWAKGASSGRVRQRGRARAIGT